MTLTLKKLYEKIWFCSKLWLTHWGRVTHICVGKSTIIGSDNGLSPERRQAIIWNNAGILWIGPLGTYFSEILTGIQAFSFKKMHLKISSAKWRPFCLGLNVLTVYQFLAAWHSVVGLALIFFIFFTASLCILFNGEGLAIVHWSLAYFSYTLQCKCSLYCPQLETHDRTLGILALTTTHTDDYPKLFVETI